MPVGEAVVESILDLVRACRPGEPEGRALADMLSWGPGPRAAQALMLTVRARALLDGRLVPNVDDVQALARPVLIHRMALSFAARARGEDLATVIDGVVARVTGLEAAA
jgi:MoxR-like ATPase